MVHVVLAGGGGNVGREILEELVTQGKHQVTVFSRGDQPALSKRGIIVKKINDYQDKEELTAALQGVHTVLSFISRDPEHVNQKALINACVAAGVKRYAPTEWSIPEGILASKTEIQEYLQEINAKKPVLEYCLFHTGIFMNYLCYPHQTAKYLHIGEIYHSVDGKQSILVDDGDYWEVYTTVQDVANVAARAINYPDKWPEVGGVVGTRIKARDLVKLAEEIRGEPFTIHRVSSEDIAKGEMRTSWVPEFSHPNMPPGMKELVATRVLPKLLHLTSTGGSDITPVWNKILPDMQFTGLETFLRGVYGKN